MVKRLILFILVIINALMMIGCSNSRIDVYFVNINSYETSFYKTIKSEEDFMIDKEWFDNNNFYEVYGFFLLESPNKYGVCLYSYLDYTNVDSIDEGLINFITEEYNNKYDSSDCNVSWYEKSTDESVTVSDMINISTKVKIGEHYSGPFKINRGVYNIFGYDGNGKELGSMFLPNLSLEMEYTVDDTYDEGVPILQQFRFTKVEIFSGDNAQEFLIPNNFLGGLTFGNELNASDEVLFTFGDSIFQIRCEFYEYINDTISPTI